MTRKELEQLIQAMADGALDETEFAQLQDELKTNAESQAFYRQSMEVEMLLVEAMEKQVEQGEQGAPRRGVENFLHHRQRRSFSIALLASAAILVISGILMALVMIKQPTSPSLSCNLVPGTEWTVNGEKPTDDSTEFAVTEGSTVHVLSGTVRMELESGAVMVMRGPAEAFFPKLERPILKNGWLWIDSGGSTDAFEVETPELIVRDIGTRFGVRVRENGFAEVHLIEGVVEVESKDSKQKSLTLRPVGKGVFIPEWGPNSELPLGLDPFPDLPSLLAAPPNYRTTVLAQGPVGYWRLEEKTLLKLSNEIPEGITGQRAYSAVAGTAGVGSSADFNGFPTGNRAVYLSGEPPSNVIMNIDAPGGVSKEEGGVAFWIRRLPGNEREEVLWMAGKGLNDEAQTPHESMMHTQLSKSGRVEFFVDNGDFDIRLSSNFSVVDGRWHQIVASWGISAVELYVDGRRVERADDFGSLSRGVMRGRFVRFGKPSLDLHQLNRKPFTGWVDEIALWNRSLTPTEVKLQFASAIGRN